jgi:hypothetical protein
MDAIEMDRRTAQELTDKAVKAEEKKKYEQDTSWGTAGLQGASTGAQIGGVVGPVGSAWGALAGGILGTGYGMGKAIKARQNAGQSGLEAFGRTIGDVGSPIKAAIENPELALGAGKGVASAFKDKNKPTSPPSTSAISPRDQSAVMDSLRAKNLSGPAIPTSNTGDKFRFGSQKQGGELPSTFLVEETEPSGFGEKVSLDNEPTIDDLLKMTPEERNAWILSQKDNQYGA